MQEIKLDLSPAYISFEKQATKADGTKINPAATPTVSIYEETGVDNAYDNSQIAGSPFNCAIINAKVGNYGVLVSKALFTAGKIYRVLFEWSVDGIDTAWEENFLATNAADMKANVANLDVAVSSRSSHNAAAIWTAGARGLTTPGDYKADVSGVAIEGNVKGHAADALSDYDPPTRGEATSDKDEIITEVNENEGKIDIVDTNVDAVKAKTDNLPVDPATEAKQDTIISDVSDIVTADRNFNTSGD